MTRSAGDRVWRIAGTLARTAFLAAGMMPFLPWVFYSLGLGVLATPIEAWFELQCHRESGRSIALFGELLPVCARCTGIYLGLGLGALFLRPRVGVWPLRIWVGLAAVVMILDVATETLAMRPALLPFRVLTGILLAYPVAVAAVWAARGETLPAPDEVSP